MELTTDRFLERFTLLKPLGSGAFGLVMKVLDTNEYRALKLIPFDASDSEPDFSELKIVSQVTRLKSKIPTLCDARDFGVITDRELCHHISKTEFDKLYCAPTYDEITGFMFYVMPIYTPLDYDTLTLKQQDSVNEQIKTTIKQLSAHGIVEYDMVSISEDPQVAYRNIMFQDETRQTIVVIDLDMFQVEADQNPSVL